MTLDPAAIERFRRDLEALTRAPPAPDAPLGLAVSGGPDSMALLLLGATAFPGAVRAATVDHGLRPEAPGEAALVAQVSASLGVPHVTLTLSGVADSGNLQERAREGRYAALAGWAGENRIGAVAVAHQRDDVAETLLMRARRGAGVGGMAEMQRVRPLIAGSGVTLLRPLLGWSRAELGAIVAAGGVVAADDPSNRSMAFDRVRIRALLAATPELPASRLALAARNLRHAEDALDWATAQAAATRFISDAERVTIDPADLPHELRYRLVRAAVEQVRAAQGITAKWRESGLERLIAGLEAGDTGTIAEVKAEVRQGKWRFSMAPARRSH